eukprot:3734519-Pleurochrysis_carterae.AAC.5
MSSPISPLPTIMRPSASAPPDTSLRNISTILCRMMTYPAPLCETADQSTSSATVTVQQPAFILRGPSRVTL